MLFLLADREQETTSNLAHGFSHSISYKKSAFDPVQQASFAPLTRPATDEAGVKEMSGVSETAAAAILYVYRCRGELRVNSCLNHVHR